MREDYSASLFFYIMSTMTEHLKYHYDYARNDLDRPNPFTSSNQDFWEEDGISLTGNPGAPAPDTLTFNINMEPDKIDLNLEATSKNGFWKYEEDKTLKEVRDYLSGTYQSHYTSKDSKTQTLDLIGGIGDGEPFCRSNAIKYLSRFGKKNGKSKQDILKAIHYCILLYHFAGLHNETKGTYETF